MLQMQAGIRKTTSTLPIIGPGEDQKIRQVTFIRPAQMGLFARVTCYPPLGQVTSLQRQKELKPEEDDTVCTQGIVLPDHDRMWYFKKHTDLLARFDLQL